MAGAAGPSYRYIQNLDKLADAAAAQKASQILSAFLPYKLDVVALWSRIFAAQGEPAQALQVCEQAVQEQQARDIKPYGLIDLYVALAEAQERLHRHAAACSTVESALPVLQRCAADILDSAQRAVYPKEVPKNAHLLELAAQWGIAAAAR